MRWWQLYKDERRDHCYVCKKKFSRFSRVEILTDLANTIYIVHPGCYTKAVAHEEVIVE